MEGKGRVEFWERCLGCKEVDLEGQRDDEEMKERVKSFTDLIHRDDGVHEVPVLENDEEGNHNENSFHGLDVCECEEGGEWEVDIDNEEFEFCLLCGADRR